MLLFSIYDKSMNILKIKKGFNSLKPLLVLG